MQLSTMYQHLRGLAVLAALVSLGMLHPSLVSAEQIPPELERAGYVDFHREQALKMRTDVSIVQTFTTLTVVSASNPKPLTHEQASAILETIATEEVSMNMGRTLRHSVERNASDDMDKLAIVSPEIRNALSDYVLINMNHAVYRHCRKKLEAHPAFRNADNAPFGESTSVGMRRRYRRTADSATVTPAHFKAVSEFVVRSVVSDFSPQDTAATLASLQNASKGDVVKFTSPASLRPSLRLAMTEVANVATDVVQTGVTEVGGAAKSSLWSQTKAAMMKNKIMFICGGVVLLVFVIVIIIQLAGGFSSHNNKIKA